MAGEDGEATWGHEQDATSTRDQRLPLVLPPSSNRWAGFHFPTLPGVINSDKPLPAQQSLRHRVTVQQRDTLPAPAPAQSLRPCNNHSPSAISQARAGLWSPGTRKDLPLQALGTPTGCAAQSCFPIPVNTVSIQIPQGNAPAVTPAALLPNETRWTRHAPGKGSNIFLPANPTANPRPAAKRGCHLRGEGLPLPPRTTTQRREGQEPRTSNGDGHPQVTSGRGEVRTPLLLTPPP